MPKGKNVFFNDGAAVGAVVLCALGTLISAYLLTADFLLGGAEFCLTGEGCDAVRNSRYSSMGGIPVSLLGLLGYASVAVALILPLGRKTKWNLLFAFSAAAVGFSAYLTYLELFIIEALCSWCVASAAITIVLFLIAALRKKMDGGASALKSLGGAAALLVVVYAVSYSVHSPSPEKDFPSTASFYQVGLAKYLSQHGATMYGSYTCAHCDKQKKLFGGAFAYIPYVECNRRGPDPDPALCKTKSIKSYPTWEIEGKLYRGMKTLEQLGEISGYSGKR